MTAQQLDLFGTTGLVTVPMAQPSRDRAAENEPRASEELDAQAPSANVEPYRFKLADPDGRWTITAAHEDETMRGKTRRSLVARCSCGWMQPFSPRSYGTASPDRILAHMRSHQLAARPPAFAVEEECGAWQQARLLAGRMHCASAECHRLAPKDHRIVGGFAEACPEHGGTLHDRVYHWEEHDPEDYASEPPTSHKGCLRGPDGRTWHYWCAPLEGRRLFGFVREDEGDIEPNDWDGDDDSADAPPLAAPDVEPDESPTGLWCAGKDAGGLDHYGNRIPAAVQRIDTRAPLCLVCARCPRCLAAGDELCSCFGPCPEQDRDRLTIEWADEPYPGGRWGLVTGMDGPVICAARNTSCRAGREIWSGLHAPSKDRRELVWQYPDGCIVHYRCAPDEARHGFDVEYAGVALGKDPHPANNSRPRRATLDSIDGEWMFTGLMSRGDTRRYSAILWRRLGAALALETPVPNDRPDGAAAA
ncbi:MAG: hypothetical protein R3C39_10885 [Dehalococcoidia bacterium]